MAQLLSIVVSLLFFASILLLVIGLIKPSIVPHIGKEHTRKNILKTGALLICFTFLMVMFIGSTAKKEIVSTSDRKSETEHKEKLSTPASEKENKKEKFSLESTKIEKEKVTDELINYECALIQKRFDGKSFPWRIEIDFEMGSAKLVSKKFIADVTKSKALSYGRERTFISIWLPDTYQMVNPFITSDYDKKTKRVSVSFHVDNVPPRKYKHIVDAYYKSLPKD